jgi:flagellar basal-body rod protein FlgB
MGFRPGGTRNDNFPDASLFPGGLPGGHERSGTDVDTPGYHTTDINFKQTLLSASNGNGAAQLTPVVNEVGGLLERPDGNNVDLDRESLLLAQSQLQYQMGVQLVKSNFHQLLSAINGGS